MTQNCGRSKKQGLKKKEKLLKPVQYKYVYQQGRLFKGSELWCYICPNGLEHNRIGISISKKVCPSAVRRNRAKRLLREAFRLNKEKERKTAGKDHVYVVKKIPELKMESIREIIRQIAV